MKNIITRLFKLFQLIFGAFHWEPPQWCKWIQTKLVALSLKLKTEHQLHKIRFYSFMLSFMLLLIIGGVTYQWYTHLPQPVEISVQALKIQPTPLEKYAKPDPFQIRFGGSAAKLSEVGKPISTGIVVTPKLQGEWKWTTDDTLTFTVAGDWAIGKKYQIRLNESLFPSHVYLETYEVELSTPHFEVQIDETFFYQNPTRAEDKKVIAEVHFTHPVDPKSFEEKVSFLFQTGGREKDRTLQEKKISFTTTYDEFGGKAYLHSENLPIPNYESQMKLEIAEGVQSRFGGDGSATENINTTTIPGMLTHFRFATPDVNLVRNEEYEPQQVLTLSSRVGVAQKQLSEYLEVYALPRDRLTLSSDKKVQKNYSWSVSTVTKNILFSAKKLALQPIPTEKDYSEIISYQYEEEPGVYLYIKIKEGLTSFGGYRLPETLSFVVQVPEFPQELKIMAEGSLLSLAGEKKLSILARDLEHIRYQAQRLLPGQIAHFVSQSYGQLGEPSFDSYQFGLENIAETVHQVDTLPIVGRGKTQYSHFDFSNLLKRSQGTPKGLFNLVVEGWDNLNQSAFGPRDERFIFITDIGILAKKSLDGSYDLFLQSISNGEPISEAQVQVIGKNGLPVLSAISGASGHVSFANLKDFKREKQPIVFVVTKGEDLSFLPIGTHVNRLNYSRFDVGGEYTKLQSDRLEGYIFSDRGIYRPGEEIRLGYIVKHSDWSRDLSGIDLEMMVSDPKGSIIRHTKGLRLNKIGMKTYPFQTGETWPTGNYIVSLFVKKDQQEIVQIGSTTVKVEEFIPDRLKINARFSKPSNKGWLQPDGLEGIVNVNNLFGTPAQDRRIVAEIALQPSYPSFHLYRDWSFHDPMRSKKSFDEQLGEQRTDSSGNAIFNLGLDKFESASYLLQFMVEGFEAEGGRSVLASNAVLISPLDYLIGYKTEGDLNYIKKDTQIGVDFIAINSNLEQVSVQGLKVKTVEFRQVSTLVKQNNGTYKYESVRKEYELKQENMNISANKTNQQLDTSQPGDFALVILNQENLELNRVQYRVAGSANLSFELEKNAELQVTLNKSDFNPNEEIEISIRSPYVGGGLMTIEREKVYAHQWFTTDQKSSIQRIRIPSDLEGNGYLNITFVRSMDSNEIFMSPLSTSVIPFSINKSNRMHTISLEIPPLVRPGTSLPIDISSSKEGKAVVFAIDEGILQVAKYQNPDPLGSFYKKRALEVETRQILDLILPEFSKLALKRSSEAGGAASLLGKNLNPFKRKRDKAVTYWSGLIDIGPTTTRLSYEVPDYFSGQLRVIAVAVSPEAMGSASDKTLVKGHFVLSPNIPNFIAPGDDLNISVGVSNNVEKSGKKAEVEIRLETSTNIQVKGDSLVKLNIDEGSESTAKFEVRVQEPLGNANFIFVAKHQDQSSQRTVTASIRPATPYVTSLQTGYIEAGKKSKMDTPRKMYTEFRNNEVSVSKLPMSLATAFSSFLEKYPYGCTEQMISKRFPALIFAQYPELTTNKASVASQVEEMTEILAARQLPEGGFMKWPGDSTMNAFHTMYAGHYLTEANERGYRIPKILMESTLTYIKGFSEREPENLEMARVQAYGAYLLTRNEMIATKALTSLEKWLEGYEDDLWIKDVMLLYMAGAHQMMKASEKAQMLLRKFDQSSEMPTDYYYGVFDETIKHAMHLYLISKHFPQLLEERGESTLKALVEKLSKTYNTASSALSMLAFEAYGQRVNAESTEGLIVSENVDNTENTLTLTGSLFPKTSFSEKATNIFIENETKNVAYYSVTQAGFDREPSQAEMTNGIEVFREYLNRDGEVVERAKIGEELTVRLRSRTTDSNWAYNLAIVDLLPGGFEVVLDSIDRENSQIEYIDVREDRVLVFDHFSPQVKTFEYKIKAINKGSYEVPPIFSESMYNRNIQFKGVTKSIVIE